MASILRRLRARRYQSPSFSSTPRRFMDANVLIDFCEADRAVIRLVSEHSHSPRAAARPSRRPEQGEIQVRRRRFGL
ncbi:MAG TPA: hypothetical protein VKY73_12240 [Polyangiaceae bacterium]|nr:hypothetical protein [Polyangiaceae bacterium]